MNNILVSGGAGYVGSVLVPQLVEKGYNVNVLDTFWFWDSPEEYRQRIGANGNLKLFKGDLRDVEDIQKSIEGIDTVIQLACVSNDPSSDVDPKFTHSVNYDGNINIIDQARKAGVKRFIYASSSSVYGIKDEPNVTEDMLLEPITQYSKLKVEVEHYLQHVKSDDFQAVIVRPSTVCGYSPRQRLDVVVNILTNFAVNKGKIKVFGGEQLRPNIHIQDMADLYIKLVGMDFSKINGEAYNGGWQNLKVKEIANLVKSVVGDVEVETVPTDDNRSYHVSSEKMKRDLGFVPSHTVEEAIADLQKAFKEGKFKNIDDDKYYNVRLMKRFLGV